MLVALSGAQGSGKTTVLNNLKAIGFNLVERKTARSILSEWNTTLDAVYRDPPTAQKFQEECLVRKIADEAEAVASEQLWFTERSYADVFTYTLLTISRYNEYDTWMNDYYNDCAIHQKKYLAVFYFQGGAFKTEDDGVRGFNQHYVRLVDETIFSTLERMSNPPSATYPAHPPLFTIQKYVSGVDERTREVAKRCQQLWLDKRLPEPQVCFRSKPSSKLLIPDEIQI